MMEALRWLLVAVGTLLVAGTTASLLQVPHWSVRMWDFPRAQTAAAALLVGVAYLAGWFEGRALEWVFLGALGAAVVRQVWKIVPYTPLAPRRVEAACQPGAPRLRLLMANVLMENRDYPRVLEVVRATGPDVVLLVETDRRWAEALEPLTEQYPHTILHPRENYYGMMLFSRLPLREGRVAFLVQDDIPSVHAQVELPGGRRVHLHGLHPRPPEPIRDQDSTPRDAELVVMARAIREAGSRPTVVAGDLNDVAWSPTSELFLRLSGLLDPRLGRGMYSTFDARRPLFRYPLDHIFHSNHFRLVELRRLGSIGSDHFPVLAELSLEGDAPAEQPAEQPEPGDRERASEKLERQEQAARTGDDRPARE